MLFFLELCGAVLFHWGLFFIAERGKIREFCEDRLQRGVSSVLERALGLEFLLELGQNPGMSREQQQQHVLGSGASSD